MSQVGVPSQLFYDTDLNKYRMMDGVTPGGFLLQREDIASVAAMIRFSAVQTKSVPATVWTAADIDKLNIVTVAGTYTMPAATGFGIGHPISVRPQVTGVILQVYVASGDLIYDKGAAGAGTINLTQYEIMEIVKEDVNVLRVWRRY